MNSIAFTTATDYAEAVRHALGDLPADQIRALVDGLDDHLAEIAADGTTDLGEALGPPAAYAAELRSAAGLPPAAHVVEPTDPQPVAATPAPFPPTDAALAASAGRNWWMIVARVAIASVLAVLLIVVIRVSDPLNGLQIAAGAAGIGAAWWVMRWVVDRAHLAGAWAKGAPIVLGVAAILGAVLLGAQMAGSHDTLVYVDAGVPTTIAPFGPEGFVTMPDLVGFAIPDANDMLVAQGFKVTIDTTGAGPLDQTVVWTDPAAGTVLPAGAHITLGVTYRRANDIASIGPATSAP